MTIEIIDGRYFAAFVHVEFREPDGNFHGALFRDEGQDELQFIFRLRYYVDDRRDITSKDKKQWFGGSVPRKPGETDDQQEERGIDGFKVIADTVIAHEAKSIRERHILRVRSSDPKVVAEAITTAPWASVQHMKIAGQA